jgi:D-alanyl-D-alanine carboxypeptidase
MKTNPVVMFALSAMLLWLTACSKKTPPAPMPDTPSPSSTPLPELTLPFAQELQDVLDDGLRATHGTGVSAAVHVPGQGTWTGVSGMSDLSASNRIKRDMLFDIASVGKTFTAALVLQLAEEGLLSLEDPLHTWLPAYPNIESTITVRQLLNHTSGIFDFVENDAYWHSVLGDPKRLWEPADVLALVREPYFSSGQGARYSSTNYILLGMIVEQVTGSTMDEQIRTRFLVPLDLTHTFSLGSESISGELAHGHFDLDGDGEMEDMASIPRTAIDSSKWACGSIASTAEDVARWADALYGGRILGPEAMKQMLSFYRPVAEAPGDPLASGYGLGGCRSLRPGSNGCGGIWASFPDTWRLCCMCPPILRPSWC